MLQGKQLRCRLQVSANNNSWPAPGRRGYSLDSDGEPRSPYEVNTMGPARTPGREPPGRVDSPGPMSLTSVRHLRGRRGRMAWSRSEGSPLVSLCIMRAGWRCPQLGTDPVQIVDNLSILDRKFTDQLLLAVQASVDHIGETKFAVFHTEHGNIGDCALGEIAQFLVTNFMSRVRGHLGDYFLQWNIHRHDLVRDIEFILHRAIHAGDMEGGGDGIGDEPVLDHGNCEGPLEAAAALANVEVDTALAAFD